MLMSDFVFVNVGNMALNVGPSCVLHCWLLHTKQCRSYLCQFLGGEWATNVGTAAHMMKQCFLHPLCCQSLTITGAGICFSKPSCLAFFSGSLLNFSRNSLILGQFFGMCVVCFAHTLSVQLSMLVLAIVTTLWLSLTMAAKHDQRSCYTTASCFVVYHSTPSVFTHHTCGKLGGGMVSSSPLFVHISWYLIIFFPWDSFWYFLSSSDTKYCRTQLRVIEW